MNLYIIGKGFDLAHCLHTSYWDFRTYLKEHDGVFLDVFEEEYYLWGEKLKTLLWNDFEFNLANLQEDVLVEQMYQNTDLGLESGNLVIESTLKYYFSDEFRYIEKLTSYLHDWITEVN